MRFSFRQSAGEFQRFAPDAFDSQVGRAVALTAGVDSQRIGTARLVNAQVNADGSNVELTYEVADGSAACGFIEAGFRGSLGSGTFTAGPRGSTPRPGGRLNLSLPPVVRENGSTPES